MGSQNVENQEINRSKKPTGWIIATIVLATLLVVSLVFIFIRESEGSDGAVAVDVQELEDGKNTYQLDEIVYSDDLLATLKSDKNAYYPDDKITRENLLVILEKQRVDYPALRPLVVYMLSRGVPMGSNPSFGSSDGASWVNAFLSVGAVEVFECSRDILAQIPPEVSGMYGARCVLAERADSLMADMFNLENPRVTLSEETVGYFIAGGVGVYVTNGGVQYNPEYIIEEVERNDDRLTVKFAQVKFDRAPMDGRPWNITDRFEVVVQDLGSGRIRLISVGE